MPTKMGRKTRVEKRRENRRLLRYGQRVVANARAAHLEDILQRALQDGLVLGQFEDKTFDWIFRGIAESLAAKEMCRLFRVDHSAFHRNVMGNSDLYQLYMRAREIQSEAFADLNDELLSAPLDYESDGAAVELAHRKAIAENRRWLMAKNHVRRFGDKVVVEGGEKPIVHDHSHEHTVQQLAESYGERVKRLGRG